jgi:predicted kinase
MVCPVNLILMCGLSFSGKSTLAQLLAHELGAVVVSLDGINEERGLFGGQGIPEEEWVRTHRIGDTRASDHLRSGTDVIVDDTGSPRFVRDHWRDIASREGARFSLVWVQIDSALRQDRLRATRATHDRHDVTDEVLAEHVADFQPPSAEHPITVDARDVRDLSRVRSIAASLRQSA